MNFIQEITTSVDKKKALKNSINDMFLRAEARGSFRRAPSFSQNYHADYPELKRLEDNYPIIREECLRLLDMKDRLTDIQALGGKYTTGGIHGIKWKSFMFKSGVFVKENCKLAPRTAQLLREIPYVYTAFFSVLDPQQYITPHWGYWKGFLRYHLGILIPNNNQDNSCWLRINSNRLDNELRDKTLIEKGDKYYWHDGEGVMFDDTFLHDAQNGSDQVRVVMWLDVRRRLPWHLSAINHAALRIAQAVPEVARVRKNAIVRTDAEK
ncbi:MAG: aspartyl/asparaginyl beta-hydroxylase domain-containing protein [Myxococcales bacterium]|nr:aspartyl/asparaginyl beta-hydroxylase domain-containing protein [Myxococcales bacterium]MCB9708938.1 aspartyl/asparaginyl beta-hydroxylase domain-containing protein [Myxococcales bacterium]